MQSQNGNTSPMQPSYGKKFWYLWGPVVIRWVISFAVGIAAMFVYMSVYIYQHPEESASAMRNQQDMMDLSLSISEKMMQYVTQLEGVIALVTIPVMAIWFWYDRRKEKRMGVSVNKKASLWKYAGIILMTAGLCIGLNNLMLLSNLSALSSSYDGTMEALYSSNFIIQLICLGILTPISEELVFRGMVFKRLREQGGFLQAALYSSAVFGFLHMNLVQMLYGFIFGMMLSYVYEKYGSVKAPILAHIVANLISVVFTEYEVFSFITEDIMRIGIVTAGCAALASTMFVLIQRIEEKPDVLEEKKENPAV